MSMKLNSARHIGSAFLLTWEAISEGRFLSALREQVFRARIATPTVRDIAQLKVDEHAFDAGYRFFELKADDLAGDEWTFVVPSRRIKAARYLKSGARGFAVAEGTVIIGDVWCLVVNSRNHSICRADLDMLGIQCEQGDAYGMDMFIAPDWRGKNLAIPLQLYFQSVLKAEGCKKIYGYFWDDNLPAIWMHRKLEYRELPKRKVSRFFIFRRAVPVD